MPRPENSLDTIAALATAPGRAALAVIRISGTRAREALRALGVRPGPPRLARLVNIKGLDGALIDRGLVLWFPAPASYTGENCAEIHLHGGRFLVGSVLSALVTAGVRLAEPGEFTRRAFQNGKMDLSEAEAVADLIEAETAAQAHQAIRQLEGALGARHQTWREQLLEVLARLEALVDFPEEETAHALEGTRLALDALKTELSSAMADGLRGKRIREGYRVAVIGPPNAGKSSLFNAILAHDAAIVSDLPGTTRDLIEGAVDVRGYRVLIADTAGLHASDHPVEAEGIRRALDWAMKADRRIWVIDGAEAAVGPHEGEAAWRRGDLCLLNKADLPKGLTAGQTADRAEAAGLTVLRLSVARDGAQPVMDWLAGNVEAAMSGSDFPSVTRLRHEAALAEAVEALGRSVMRLDDPELSGEDVRLATRALASITGSIATEDILGRVFATFCIGK